MSPTAASRFWQLACILLALGGAVSAHRHSHFKRQGVAGEEDAGSSCTPTWCMFWDSGPATTVQVNFLYCDLKSVQQLIPAMHHQFGSDPTKYQAWNGTGTGNGNDGDENDYPIIATQFRVPLQTNGGNLDSALAAFGTSTTGLCAPRPRS